MERVKKTIRTRPMPESQILKFERDLSKHPWTEIFSNLTVDEQTDEYHNFLRAKLDLYFPEKIVNISSLDKKWMSPTLKQLHRRMQRSFHKNRGNLKYEKLKLKFKRMKRAAIKAFYAEFVTELKSINPSKWYSMAKKIGAIDQMSQGDVKVESLVNLDNLQAAKKIAEHFSAVSNEYLPVDLTELPCYLPAPPPPQVEEYDVYLRLNRTV